MALVAHFSLALALLFSRFSVDVRAGLGTYVALKTKAREEEEREGGEEKEEKEGEKGEGKGGEKRGGDF